MKSGRYDVTFAVLRQQGKAIVRVEDGLLTGETDRGTQLDGFVGIDEGRQVVRFEIGAVIKPHATSITGVTAGDEPRRIVFRGEAAMTTAAARFSIDFAGRAIDIEARYIGPL